MSNTTFERFSDLDVRPDIRDALARSGFVTPTPIQKLVLPDALAGRDVFGQAQTGTGKTLAFAIPIAQKVDPAARYVQAVVLVPTRELAKQVANEIEKVTVTTKGLRCVAIYGGVGQQPQVDALSSGAQVVIGTPGRVVDLMRQKELKLDRVSIAVLDEVDEMLDMGFYDEVHTVMTATPKTRQTMFFSATIPPRIQKMGRSYLRREVIHTTSEANLLVDSTEHAFYEVPGRERLEGLMRLIDCEDISKAIIFTNTKIEADRVCVALARVGYPVEGLHGDLPQAKRESVMARFREGKTAIVVATDVAARGLDIRDVTHVIHYHIPLDPETFVHRTGRTGRAGASGKSIMIVSPAEYHDLFKIQEANHLAIQNYPLPSEEAAFAKRMEKMFDKILRGLASEDISTVYKEMKKHIPLFKRGKALAWLVKKCSEGGFRISESGSAPVRGVAAAVQGPEARLFVNIGRRHGTNESQLREFLAKEAGIKETQVGRIDAKDGYSHVSVESGVAETIISKASGKKMGRFVVKIEIAKSRESERGERGDRGDRGGRDGRRERDGRRDERGPRSSRPARPERAPRQERDSAAEGESTPASDGTQGALPREGSGVRVRRRGGRGGRGREQRQSEAGQTGGSEESSSENRSEVEFRDDTSEN
ncbi:MAG TPA: DEAD/DEAH box helicase [Spirochaetota bacterium]|nr:DEAD/DEAH box helicase [Spirochaetota bacterium]